MSKLDRIQWEVSTLVATLRARAAGIALGKGLRALGQPILVRPEGASISVGDRVVLTSRSKGTALGVRAPVILRCLAPGARIEVGDDSGLSGTAVCAATLVRIGKRCLIGADCMIFDTDFHSHEPEGRRYAQPDWAAISAPTIIEDDVFLGTRTIVTKGVTIGRGSIVAAGSVVTRDLPPMSVSAGAPAKVLRLLTA